MIEDGDLALDLPRWGTPRLMGHSRGGKFGDVGSERKRNYRAKDLQYLFWGLRSFRFSVFQSHPQNRCRTVGKYMKI